ncbi:hypothetical protein D1872_270330 [compost metagenome]
MPSSNIVNGLTLADLSGATVSEEPVSSITLSMVDNIYPAYNPIPINSTIKTVSINFANFLPNEDFFFGFTRFEACLL